MPPSDPNLHDNGKHPHSPRNGSSGRAPLTSPQFALIDTTAHRPVPAAPALNAAPNPLALLKALRRRWLPALAAGLVLGAVAAVVTWYFPGLVRTGAYSVVRVNAKPRHLVYNVGDSEFDFEKYQKTQAALVRQQSILEAALRDPKVADLASLPAPAQRVAWLERDLTVDFTAGPEVMRITLKGEHPTELVDVVNAVTREYLRESARLEREDLAVRLEKVTAAAGKYQEELRVKREALHKLTGSLVEDTDATRTAVKQRLAAEQLGQAERDLLQVRSELARLESEVETRRAREKGPAPEVPDYLVEDAIDTRLQKDPFIAKAVTRLAELDAEIGVVMRVARDPERQSAKARREAEAVREAVESYRRQIRTIVVKSLQDRARGDFHAETQKMTERVATLRQQERLLADRTKQLAEDAGQGKGGVDVQPLRDDIAKAEEVARKVGEQAQALRIEQDEPPRVTLLQQAVVLPRDDRKQMQMAGMAGLGVFGCVVFGFAWWEFRSRRVATPDEVSQGLGLRLLGALPRMPERVRRRLGGPNGKQDQRWHSLLNESIDVTRTLLLHDAQAGSLQVVLVTSAAEGEGKTSLATQLAASLARAGRKTLLIDCDLRKPAAHRLFELPLEPGFSEVLRGEVHLADVVRPTRLSRLWLISAGICDSHATQALAQDNVEAVFEELRGQYDYIVLDSAPVLPVADSLLLARHADGVIFAILRDESRLPRVHAAQQRLAAVGVRVLGAVLNGTTGDAYGSAYQDSTPVVAR
jgi:capsular exopolysaccharide synthesis family protein